MTAVAPVRESISLHGLTESEARARRERGQGNNIQLATSRSYLDIIWQNVFTFVNMVLFGIGIVLIVLGLYTDALLSVGIVALNVVIGVIQEARAKRTLDQIALLTRPRATIIREGREKIVDPAEIVTGDLLLVKPGDQIVVDGVVVGADRMEVDESLLTGEADPIPKRANDRVLSGSYCVSGSAHYLADKVGAESFANRLTSSARTFKMAKTPLQRDIDVLIRVLVLLASHIGILLAIAVFVEQLSLSSSARIAAVVAGLIPNGLFFMISIAYAMGAVRMAGRGALIQQSNAVESMSNVNILCLDKTGTLTANQIAYHEFEVLGAAEEYCKRSLGDFVASVTVKNRTAEAVAQAFSGRARRVIDEVPFSSALKWSALSIDDEDMRGVFALGAPEMLVPYLHDIDLGSKYGEWTDNGLRVLLFAHYPEPVSLYDQAGRPVLPDGLKPLGLISFKDVLRSEARKTLEQFAQAGIRLKIISGDNPHTVTALARQAGFSRDVQTYSGIDLEKMDDAQFAQAAETGTIFGRITPQQKERLVNALRSQGHYVAMIGDGVNDVLSLKKAQIGIAMQSGSDATRGVADIVLMNDSFAALPSAFLEGQRIINGMQDILRLFLTRVFAMALIILGASVVGLSFPFSPINSSLLTLLTVGIPTFALAAWARPGTPPKSSLLNTMLHFVLPAAFTLWIAGIGIYAFFYIATFQSTLGVTHVQTAEEVVALERALGKPITDLVQTATAAATGTAQTALTTLMTLCGLLLVIFVEPPNRFWVGGDEYSGDWRPTILVGVLLLAFVVVMLVPQFREFFDLELLPLDAHALIAAVVIIWAAALRYVWRAHLFDRFLNLGVKESLARPEKG